MKSLSRIQVSTLKKWKQFTLLSNNADVAAAAWHQGIGRHQDARKCLQEGQLHVPRNSRARIVAARLRIHGFRWNKKVHWQGPCHTRGSADGFRERLKGGWVILVEYQHTGRSVPRAAIINLWRIWALIHSKQSRLKHEKHLHARESGPYC